MGWGSGSELAERLWREVRMKVTDPKERQRLARSFIASFEEADCDTLDECEKLIADAGAEWWRRRSYR